MSLVAGTVPAVTSQRRPRPTLDALIDECETLGITVRRGRMPAGQTGCYDLRSRTIWLAHDLTPREEVPTLLHEMAHAAAGHDGHQDRTTEAHIDLGVARVLITVEDLARAEALVGPSVGAQAEELDVPTWVIRALHRTLQPV